LSALAFAVAVAVAMRIFPRWFDLEAGAAAG